MADPILVADIGGTNARFALAEPGDAGPVVRNAQTFRAEDFETIRDAADAYFESVGEKARRACFAVAAPVGEAEITFTNSHWTFRPVEIEQSLELDRLRIINDFYALAAGVGHIPNDGFVAVKAGDADPSAPMLVIGPGTGLGQALIVPTPTAGAVIVSTEGGHVSFAPRDETEIAVMKFIAREHPRVSVERLLSGRGLVNIHRALCAIEGAQRVSLQANEITKAAIDESYPIAIKAVDMFCSVLGAVTGDAVLSTGARGGVVLGGGILPKIKDVFLNSDFEQKFLNKGRMRGYVETVPIKLIVAEGAALYGAAASLS